MPFEIIDMASWGSGEPNEDCAGCAANLAWVIDGATDLVDAPLVGEVSDAAWLAGQAHTILGELALDAPCQLDELPQILNYRLADAFRMTSRIQPEDPWAHPSATALIARVADGWLEWIGLGDCALLIETPDGLKTVGVGGAEAGDRSTAAEVARIQKSHDVRSEEERKAQMWPKVRQQRAARLNQPGGYAALSVTPPPSELIGKGVFPATSGAHALLATDGLIRLIDIYARYDAASLFEAAKSHGLSALLGELRRIESDDADCKVHPRIKQSDDATGLLLRIT